MFGAGGGVDRLDAQLEVERLAAEARSGANRTEEPDPADELAERRTNAARSVVAFVLIVAMVVGGGWAIFGTTPALIAAGVAAILAIGWVVRRRRFRSRA